MKGWNIELENSIEKIQVFLEDRVGRRINAISRWQKS